MKMRAIDVPEDLLQLLQRSRLGNRPLEAQVQIALAIHVFQEGIISVGKAAELAGEPRASFELFLGELGIPPVKYDVEAYEQDLAAVSKARQQT